MRDSIITFGFLLSDRIRFPKQQRLVFDSIVDRDAESREWIFSWVFSDTRFEF
jgi:hypothetical protein